MGESAEIIPQATSVDNKYTDDRLHNFTVLKKKLIESNDNNYDLGNLGLMGLYRKKEYDIEQVLDIITSGDPVRQKVLSRDFFQRDGFYKQLVTYYASLINYYGILIPNPAFGASLQKKSIAKKYVQALTLIEDLKIKKLGQHIASKVLVDGMYYGVRIQNSKVKTDFTLMDLPFDYCRSRFIDVNGNSLVEFNVQFFDTITDSDYRQIALDTYPKVISSYYEKWSKGKKLSSKESIKQNSWVLLPADEGIAFNLFDSSPHFLSVIPASLQYDAAVENEQLRELEEIKKLIVQKIPHLNDGQLLFEPDEVQVMHEGAVGMLKKSNPHASVITSYGDIDVYTTKATDSVTNNILTNMLKHIYAKAGVSPELFAASGSSSLGTSINYDISLMMTLANKISIFLTNLLNDICGTSEIQFTYYILPVTEFNKNNMVDMYMKLGTAGYSFLLPGIAAGLSQRELCNVKDLENNLLKMSQFLIPLQTSYTQSSKNGSNNQEEEKESGRPALEDTQKSEKTVQNIESAGKN